MKMDIQNFKVRLQDLKAKYSEISAQKTVRYSQKVLICFGKTVMVLLNAAFIVLCLYAIVLSIGVTYGAYRVYDYANDIVEEVKYYQDNNPKQSKFMMALSDKNKDSSFVLKHKYVPIDSISKTLINSVLAAEDAGFYLHPGVDLGAIAIAFQTNKSRGKNVFGGSTITQQLAKNLFLSSEKSWERKAKELVYALLMEKYLGKKRILELYLNYAQWGKDIFGVGAISDIYYKKSPLYLSYDQSIRLASLLAKPSKYTPYSRKSLFLAKRRKVIVDNLFLSRKLGEKFYENYQGDSLLDSTVSAYKGLDPRARSMGEKAPVSESGSPLNVGNIVNPIEINDSMSGVK